MATACKQTLKSADQMDVELYNENVRDSLWFESNIEKSTSIRRVHYFVYV